MKAICHPKSMIRSLILSLLLGLPSLLLARPSDLSELLMVERDSGKWLVQVRASFSDFEQEILTRYGEKAYTSSKGFRQLMIQHLQDHILLQSDQGDSLKLRGGEVKLDHECQVVFELSAQAEALKRLRVENRAFTNIPHHQGKLVVLKKGFMPGHFFLNQTNQYSVTLVQTSDTFVIQPAIPLWIGSLLMAVPMGLLLLIWGYRKRKPFSL